MTLYAEQLPGEHHSLLFLHGWGMNGSLLLPLAEQLGNEWHRVIIDLPGHGKSPMLEGDYSIENIADALSPHLTDNTIVIGWSLGGMIAQQLAITFPNKIEKLILLASTARFTKSRDWPYATEQGVLKNFTQSLSVDFESTLQRFLMLQAKGSTSAKGDVRTLRDKLFSHGKPVLPALAGGMEILMNFDCRAELNKITQPTLLVMGERDTLMPHPVGEVIASMLPNARCHFVKQAGHAPFLSHANETVEVIKSFLHEEC